jgi:hypothetical protein
VARRTLVPAVGEDVGLCFGTLMIEILSCGSAQFGWSAAARLYDEM